MAGCDAPRCRNGFAMSPQFRSAAVRRSLVVTFSALTLVAVVATPNALAASSHANAHAAANASSHADGQTTASDHNNQGTSGTSGDPTKPQPTSRADQHSGGANGQCPGGGYCSTRDGSASANGNGGGNATGKPCAGCVGKADNKNPAGQAPNGSDANAGYECDRNHGIGRSNPAHTGCTTSGTTAGTNCTTAPTAPGCITGINTGGTNCTTTPTAPGCTTGGTTGGSDCAALPDLPQCVTAGNGCAATTMSGDTCTAVLGVNLAKTTTTTRPTTTPEARTKVLGETVTRAPTGALPLTGANAALMTAIALLATLSGLALTVGARRRGRSTV